MTHIATFVNFCGLIVSETRLGTTRDKMLDPLGSVIGEYDDSQNVTGRTEYWPYGEIASETGTLLPSPLKFVGGLGYFRDRIATFLTYIRARWYYPWSTRWTTVDALWPNVSAYRYVYSSPPTFVDVSGLLPSRPRKKPIVGPAEPSPWPAFFPNDDVVFKYGNYCGSKTWDSGPCRRPCLDCVDCSCQQHDDCLDRAEAFWGPSYYWTSGGMKCHCELLLRVSACPCITARCAIAKAAIISAFGPICLITFGTSILFSPTTSLQDWELWVDMPYEDRPGAILPNPRRGGGQIRV